MSEEFYQITHDRLAELTTAETQLTTLRAENGLMREALAPFAAVAEHDIGDDESDADWFRPMEKHNHAPRLTVGHFRIALAQVAK